MGARTVTRTPGIDVRKTSIRLQFTDHAGERHRITLKDAGGRPIPPLAGNVRTAEHTMRQIRSAIAVGAFRLRDFFPDIEDPNDPVEVKTIPTLGAYLDTWKDGLDVRRSTRGGYTAALGFWKLAPANGNGTPLGSVSLNEITPSMVRHALAVGGSRHRRGKVDNENPPKPLKGKTKNNYLAVLRAALELAVEDKLIPESPAGGKLRSKAKLPPPDPLDLDELEAVLAKIRSRSGDAVADYAEFWAFTGLRTSELNGLQWDQVDLRSGEIRVKRVLIKGEMEDETKTGAIRDVPLSERALAALERQRKRTQQRGEFVWVNPIDGIEWDGDRDFMRSHWRPALRALSIRYRRPYNLRHTRATMLLMTGVNPALAARWLGHDLKMFFERYAKWIPGNRDRDELARADAAIKAYIADKGIAYGG